MIYTGMRIGEVLALRRSDIDFKNNIIHVKRSLTRDLQEKVKLGKDTKTYNGIREIPLFPELKEVLKKNNNIDFLFLNSKGGFQTSSAINEAFKRVCKDAGIRPCIRIIRRKNKKTGKIKVIQLKSSKVNQHMLRHCFATRCIEAGMTAVVLQRILRTCEYKPDFTGLIHQYLISLRKVKLKRWKNILQNKI